MARNKLFKILSRQDKGTGLTHGIPGTLSCLFRLMLMDLNITQIKFTAYLVDYVRDKRNKIPDNRRDQSSIMGNLVKEFSRPDMTWKVFCKGVKFLQFTKFEICLKCHRQDGTSVTFTPLTVDVYDDREHESDKNANGS